MNVKRCLELLNTLENIYTLKPVTSDKLARRLGVSSRTVRNEIKEINDTIPVEVAKIEVVTGSGYLLNVYDMKKYRNLIDNIFKGSKTDIVSRNPKERVLYSIYYIATNSNVTCDDLIELHYISESTLKKDIVDMKKRLSKHNLKMLIDKHIVKIIGDEINKRKCLTKVLRELLDDDFMVCENDLFNVVDYNNITKIVSNEIYVKDIKLNDIGFKNLIIHLVIAITRLKKDKKIEVKTLCIEKDRYKDEVLIARNIVEKLEAEYDIQFPECEIQYIAIHLSGKKVVKNNLNNNKYIDLISNGLNYIYEKTGYDFRSDEKLIKDLELHAIPMITRLKSRLYLHNPMLQEIKKRYSLAYELAVVFFHYVASQLNVENDENEIGYIALHLGANLESKTKGIKVLLVCSSGLGTAKLLETKIIKYFPNAIEKMDVCSAMELTERQVSNWDLIVSTIPIEMNINKPIIYVEGLLSKSNIEQIEYFITKSKFHKDIVNDFFDESLYIKEKLKNKNVIIDKIGEVLKTNNYINDKREYIQAVEAREIIATTSLDNMVAIPHPNKALSMETKVVIVILEKPIDWDGKDVQLILSLNISKVEHSEMNKLYQLIVDIIEDKRTIDKIIDSNSFDEFMEIIQEL